MFSQELLTEEFQTYLVGLYHL